MKTFKSSCLALAERMKYPNSWPKAKNPIRAKNLRVNDKAHQKDMHYRIYKQEMQPHARKGLVDSIKSQSEPKRKTQLFISVFD